MNQEKPFCAIRRRKPDGSANVGKDWLEPMGSVTAFVDNPEIWEVVYYAIGDTLPD